MFDPKKFHHAYFIEGEKNSTLETIEDFLLEEFGIVRQGNPDFYYAEHESLGIEESRELQSMQSMRPVGGERKIFIISTGAITNEAQNSLLKVFEEPTPGTHFFVISSSRRILLPTLRSRMVIVTHRNESKNNSEETLKTSVRRFIKMSEKDRLNFIASIIEEKDRNKAEIFVTALIDELHNSMPKQAKNIKEILAFANYLKDRASSLKLILERIALLKF